MSAAALKSDGVASTIPWAGIGVGLVAVALVEAAELAWLGIEGRENAEFEREIALFQSQATRLNYEAVATLGPVQLALQEAVPTGGEPFPADAVAHAPVPLVQAA